MKSTGTNSGATTRDNFTALTPEHRVHRLRWTLSLCANILALLLLILFSNSNSALPGVIAANLHSEAGQYAAVLAHAGNSSQPAWGTDREVNPKPTYTPSAIRNSDMAGDPTNPQRLLAAYEDTSVNLNETDYASSSDAGMTWSTGAFTDSWGITGYTPFGDVNVDYDGRGVGYLSTLAISNTASLLAVITTTDGINWGTPAIAAFSPYTEYRSTTSLSVDKRTSGADAGSVYLFYYYTDVSRDPYQRGIFLRASRDEGATWTNADIKVSDVNHIFSSYPDSAVASDGTVYVSWEFLPGGSLFNVHELYLDRSTDAGRTWGMDMMIGGGPITYAGGPDAKRRELVLVQSDTCNYLRLRDRPTIVVSPTDPDTVYAVWNDGRWDTAFDLCGTQGKHSDIAFSRTTDGGLTWSTPMRVNDDPMGDGIDQFEPTMAINSDGTLGLSWYDQRYSEGHNRYYLVYAQSTDGGVTWSANTQVSDTESNPDHVQDIKQIDEIGFRKALVFVPGYVIASWLDTRGGNHQGDLFIDKGSVTMNTPTPTPSATGTPSSTPTGTSTSTPTSCAIQFSDVPEGSPFYTYVRCLACRGIVGGYPDGTFRPSNPVTRGQLAKIVSNAAGFSETPSTQTFEDVPVGSTFYLYIERLASRGYIGGYACGGAGEPCIPPDNRPYFRPDASVTRGQITKIVANAAGLNDPPGEQIFEDVVPGSTFYDYVQNLAAQGIMSGYPCGGVGEPCILPGNRPYFRPQAGATRGQVAKVVSNTFFPGCTP